MTVFSSASRVTLVGNGVAREWPFAFRVVDPAHLQVILTSPAGAETRLTDGYTVALAGSGGSVTYPTSGAPLASGWRITLRRLVPLTQESAFANQGGFYANAHEERFDLLAMADQQQQEQLDRAILAPVSDDVPFILPTAQARAGRLLTFGGTGVPSVTTVTAAQVDAVIQAGLADGKVLVELPALVGDGVTTTFDVGIPLDVAVMVDAVVGGVPQRGAALTVSGSSIVFGEPPPAGVAIIPRLIAAVDALGSVISVAGKTGAVLLTVADVGGLQGALDGKQPLAATLTALAARSIGAATATGILDRAAADARFAALSHGHDAASITSGTLDIARLPPAALERLAIVPNQAARFALTTATVQRGDTVKEDDTKLMFFVVDETNLGNSAGYEPYTVGAASSVPWTGITGKPSAFTPAVHTHAASDITDFATAVDARIAAVLGVSSASTLAEHIRDTIGATLVAGSNVGITVNDAADTITIAAAGAALISARYWRLKSTGALQWSDTGSDLCIIEMEMFTTSDASGTDQTTGKTAASSTSYNASYAAAKAIDNDSTFTGAGESRWLSTKPDVNGWVSVDFGSAIAIRSYTISNYSQAAGTVSWGSGVALEYSADNVAWTTLHLASMPVIGTSSTLRKMTVTNTQ